MSKNAYAVFMIYSLITACLYQLTFSVSSIYFVTVAQLNPLQLVLVGTILETSVFLFEIPTGVVADIYSRKLSITIGIFLTGIGFLVEGSFAMFWSILMAQVLWGVGYTFTSGALQAWITDEIGEEKAGQAFLRSEQASQLGALSGILFGTVLGTIQINLPILLGGGLFLLFGLFLATFMPETNFHPTNQGERTTFANFIHTFNSGVSLIKARPSLQGILWVGLFFGLYSEGFDRLWVAYLLQNFTFPYMEPVVWLGILEGVVMLLSIGSVEFVRKRVDTTQQITIGKSLFICSIALLVSLVLFALSPTLGIAFGAYIFINGIRSVISPLYTAWVNHRLDSSVRATILSIGSQVDACGQIVGGPLVGLIALQVSLQAGLLFSAAMLLPVIPIIRKQTIPENEEVSGIVN
jgi:MFS transporter, DHA3 family, tetracycline resistance protein